MTLEDNKEKRLTDEAHLETNEIETTGNDEQKQGKIINGYALKFGKASKDLGGFTEVISPEALKDVDLSNVFLLQNHDYS
ncbi:MAG: HK97 family phage prohead protease, partial [Vagococcus sp.]